MQRREIYHKIKPEIGTEKRSERKLPESKLSSGYERLKYLRMQFAICNAYSDSQKHNLIYDIPDSQNDKIMSDIAKETTANAFTDYISGRIRYKNGQYKLALKSFKKAIDLNSNGIEYYSNTISTLEKSNNYPDISKAHAKIMYLKSINAEILVTTGNILNEIKKPEEAVKAFKNAIDINFYKTECHNSLGLTLMNLKRYEEASESFKNAIDINPKNPNYYYNLGCTFIELKGYKEASESFKNAVDINPKNPDYHYCLGYAYKGCEEYNKAIDHFNKTLELNSDDASAYCGLGHAYNERKEYDKAINHFNKALDLDPDDASAYCGLGYAYKGRKEYDKAINHFNKALDLDPDDAPSHCGIGHTYYECKKYDKAINHFNKALDLDPDDASAYCGLGHAYNERKEYDKAIDHFNKTLKLDPDDASALCGLGHAYYKCEKYDKAINHFNKALDLDPDDASAYCGLGYAYNEHKEYNKAIEHFNKALKLNPDDAPSHRGLGCTHYKHEEYDKAIDHFNKVLKLNPDDEFSHYILGYIHYKHEEYSKAIDHFNKVLEINPKDTLSRCKVGDAYHALIEYDKAIDHFNKTLEFDPDYTSAYYSLGRAYYECEEYDKAIDHFNKALKLNPDHALSHWGLGDTYYERKEYDKAIDHFNKVLKLNPDHAPSHCGIGHAYNECKNYNKALEHLNQAIKLDPGSEHTYRLKKAIPNQDTLRIRKAVEKSAEDLATIIQDHKSYKSYQGYPITTETILILCGSNGKEQLEREELLYFEGILNGTKYRLRHYSNQPNKALTSEDLVTIQKEFLPKEYIEGSISNPAEMAGFRNRPTFFPIIPSNGTTDIGYQEWKKHCEEWNNNPAHKLHQIFRTEKDIRQEDIAMAMGDALAVIASDRKDEPQLKTAADCFFEICNEGTKKTENDHEKLYYIARTINWLAKAQLLNDANCRTIAYGILPELLDRCKLEPVIIRAKETPILKVDDICIIQHAIQFYQQRFKICKDNPKQFLEAIKKGTLTSFEAEFYKERVDREKSFNNLYPGEKNTLESLYNSSSIYQAMEEAMKQIDTIPQKDIDKDQSGYYTIAKGIRKHIENFFIDRNYSKESSMGSLHKIKETSTYYGEFMSLSNQDPRFIALGTLLERIQKLSKQATDKYLLISKPKKISESIISSDDSYNSNNNDLDDKNSVSILSEGTDLRVDYKQ